MEKRPYPPSNAPSGRATAPNVHGDVKGEEREIIPFLLLDLVISVNSFFEALLNVLPKQGDVHSSKLSVNTVIAKAQAM
jgi:hypothetical protein